MPSEEPTSQEHAREERDTPVVVALDHMDADGSVVKSGLMLADATIQALEKHQDVMISLRDLKGASTSYFNMFLRRIEEECGGTDVRQRLRFEFGSSVQEMVFRRSYESRGPRKPSQPAARPPTPSNERRSVWQRIAMALRLRRQSPNGR